MSNCTFHLCPRWLQTHVLSFPNGNLLTFSSEAMPNPTAFRLRVDPRSHQCSMKPVWCLPKLKADENCAALRWWLRGYLGIKEEIMTSAIQLELGLPRSFSLMGLWAAWMTGQWSSPKTQSNSPGVKWDGIALAVNCSSAMDCQAYPSIWPAAIRDEFVEALSSSGWIIWGPDCKSGSLEVWTSKEDL